MTLKKIHKTPLIFCPKSTKVKFLEELIPTEQSALEDCTHPESSFRMQHAVSLSLLAEAAIALAILASLLIHGANLAPKCIKSAARGPSQNEAGSSHSTWKIELKI